MIPNNSTNTSLNTVCVLLFLYFYYFCFGLQWQYESLTPASVLTSNPGSTKDHMQYLEFNQGWYLRQVP